MVIPAAVAVAATALVLMKSLLLSFISGLLWTIPEPGLFAGHDC
jgi:hypothetical protein